MNVEAAYRECRGIAQREAKNFYYAFRVLPRAKSDAMCAIYAFMRRADDLSDDESMTLEARRRAMAAWLSEWRAVRAGSPSKDAVFLALSDAQGRFGISDALLEDLVRGTSMDLDETQPGTVLVEDASLGTPSAFHVYEDFAKLYRYCYLVASVVGLVCIRIFGYRDSAAEKLAEETGVAFQLTNILRDVREDAERGRIYLPLEDLHSTSTPVRDLLLAASGKGSSDAARAVLELEAARARTFYDSASRLLPMIDRDSRAALWVMVTIYRELLDQIAVGGYAVSKRARVSTPRKLTILARGMLMAAWLRATA